MKFKQMYMNLSKISATGEEIQDEFVIAAFRFVFFFDIIETGIHSLKTVGTKLICNVCVPQCNIS